MIELHLLGRICHIAVSYIGINLQIQHWIRRLGLKLSAAFQLLDGIFQELAVKLKAH